MNAERKRLVLESWEAIGRNHDGVAVAFYDRLFEIDSGARALFAKTNMVAQRAKFVQMLGDIVRNLDLPRELIPTVSALGRRHVDYGVTEQHFDVVGSALLWTLERGLGASFTPEVRDAWSAVYRVLSATMLEGMHQSSDLGAAA